jgi:hypothetical protein
MMTVTGLCIVAVVVCISLSISFARQDYDRKGNQELCKNAYIEMCCFRTKKVVFISGEGGDIAQLI